MFSRKPASATMVRLTMTRDTDNQPAVRPPGPNLTLAWLLPIFFILFGFVAYRWWMDRGTIASTPRAVTARGDLAEDEKSTIELFKENSPSVVFITTLRADTRFGQLNLMEIPQGTGSGFVWDDAGHIVTNFHVVQGANGARVTLWDHSTYDAELVGIAPNYDLALLRIKAPASKLRPIPIGESKDLQVGQKVFAIGNPFGLDQSLTTGIVSALGRQINAVTGRPIEDVIQTDAAVNPGNSGGPLLDSAGRLIGVNTAIYSPTGGSSGIGFAVPVDTVNRMIPQLLAAGRIRRPVLGITSNDRFSQLVTRRLGVEGLLVLTVEPGSPAERAGIQPTREAPGAIVTGDVLQAIDDRKVASSQDLFAILEKHKQGDQVTLKLWQDGKTRDVKVTLDPPKE